MDDSQSRAAVLWYLDPSDANVFATLSGLVRAGGDDSLKAEVALMLGKRGDAAAAAVLVSAVISQSESAIPQALLDALTQCACLPPVQEWCRKTIDGATDSQALRAAIRISTQSKIPEMWSHLANLFESGAEEIRLATLRSITEFTVENRASVERIIRVGLGDREESVRLTAMMILNRTYGLSSRPYLEQLCVSDPSQSVRESAAWYLERLPTK